jgi:succinate dehydrogenase / fumarate reductase, iron-sulfur subunit
MTTPKTIRLQIKRQEAPGAAPTWETFELPYQPRMNVISALQAVQRNPCTCEGKETAPVSFDAACVEEVCGSCTMLINGKVRQACASLIDHLIEESGTTIRLEPMSKFPVVRDLVVDRAKIFNDLLRVRAWVPLDGSFDLGPGPRQAPEDQEWMYTLSLCMSCGCCMEACPNYSSDRPFVGAAPLSQVRLFNAHPSGKYHKSDRLEASMGEGGITDCGNAQNCAAVCPKHIPLTESIADVGRQATVHTLTKWLF